MSDTGTLPKRALTRELLVVLLIGTLGLALAFQGWRSRVPDSYWGPPFDAAQALLRHGWVPDRGPTTSFASYAPPGFAWVALPGMVMSSDPRLFNVPGGALLHLATLLGIVLLARACFGSRCAILAALLYGLSEPGLIIAGSHEPHGHPWTYVWMVYWTCWWIAGRDSRYLAAALVTWLAGMYLYMEVAPGLLILPVIWALYRPPVRARPLLVAGTLGLLMWFPYLRLEAARSFGDIKSQVLRQDIQVVNDAAVWCSVSPTLHRWEGPSAVPLSPEGLPASRTTGAVVKVGHRVLAIARGLVVNFEGLVPGAELLLLVFTLSGVLVVLNRPRDRIQFGTAARLDSYRRWLWVLAMALLVCSVLASEAAIGRVLGSSLGPLASRTLPLLRALAALSGIALLMRPSIGRVLRAPAFRVDDAPCDPRVLAVALVVLWGILLSIAEWQRHDRFLALWPLQAIVLAFFSNALSAGIGHSPRLASWAGRLLGAGVTLVIAGVIAANPFVSSRVAAWRHDGWSGRDGLEIRATDYLAKRVRAEGRDRAAIGYRIFGGGPPSSPWAAIDARLRDGERFDLLLQHRHGISNLNRCGEGLSEQDEYRIVETSPPSADALYYFDVPSRVHLRFLDRIGPYDVYKQD